MQEEQKARAVQLQQSMELAAAAAAVEADAQRCTRTETLLFNVESRLASINDKFEREVAEAPKHEEPVRKFVQEPPPLNATEAATRALEHRLSKLTASSITLLAVDLPLSRGVVDVVAVDKRGRLLLIFFPPSSKIEPVRQPRPLPQFLPCVDLLPSIISPTSMAPAAASTQSGRCPLPQLKVRRLDLVMAFDLRCHAHAVA